MQFYAALSTITFTCFIILGIYILSFKPRSNINKFFFIKSLFLASCILVGMLIQLSRNEEEVEFWYKIMLCLLIIITVLFLHFYIELTETKIRIKNKLLLYLPALIVLYFIYSSESLFSEIRRYDNGLWIFTEQYKDINFIIYMIYVTVYPLIMIFLIYNWGRKNRLNKIKKQSKILVITMISVLGISDFSDIVMSQFDFYKVPHILPVMFLFYFFALCYTLVKYSFLKFNISDITNEIISNIQDMIVILNPDKTILEANNNFNKTLSCSSGFLLNKNFNDLILPDEDFKNMFDELADGKILSFNSRIIYMTDAGSVITDSYVSRITDKFEDFTGILIVSKENRSIKQFKEFYSITDKQLEIIDSIVNGMSNREIAEKYGIHKRTVETHVFSIYNKLTVNNRVELLNLVNNFKLIQDTDKNIGE